jgi:SAM-dependent methyltransferase
MIGDGKPMTADGERVAAGTEPVAADGERVAVGVRATYDAIADTYHAELGDELDGKPLDRALLGGLAELAGAGTIADVGCGPGHVTRFLAELHPDVIGIDLSPRMIDIAREQAPALTFAVGSMLELPAEDGAWSAVVAMYSIIHLTADERIIAFGEFARTVRAGGWLLVAFHIDSPDFAAGEVNHLTDWFGERVDLDGFFLDPTDVTGDADAAGFSVMSATVRQPWPGAEYPSRRCYLLARRRGAAEPVHGA